MKLEKIAEVESELKHLEKSILKTDAESKTVKNQTEKKVQDLKESSLANKRIIEIYRDKFGSSFEDLEDTAMEDFKSKERIIKNLQRNICKLADQICQSNVIVEQLKTDIDFFMGRDPKIIMGVDHMGGNILCVNK